MSNEPFKEIEPSHLGNQTVLMPIEEFIDRVLAKKWRTTDGSGSMKSATEEHKKNALKWFSSKNIHFVGQLLLGAFQEKHYQGLPSKATFKQTLKELGFDVNQYVRIIRDNPSLQATLMQEDIKFWTDARGYCAPDIDRLTKEYNPFAAKSRDEIENALKAMFRIGDDILVAKPHTPEESQPNGVVVRLSKEWEEKASKTYQPSFIEDITAALQSDTRIKGLIEYATKTAAQGRETSTNLIDPPEGQKDVVVIDTTEAVGGLARLFGEASQPLTDRIKANLDIIAPQIQQRAKEIIAEKVQASLGLDKI